MKANWHVDSAVANTEIDPFEVGTSDAMLATFNPGGAPINLDSPEPELNTRLQSLSRWEGRLNARGITCELKQMPGASCLACPVSKADDDSSPKCALCRVGITQELVVMALIAQQVARQGDAV